MIVEVFSVKRFAGLTERLPKKAVGTSEDAVSTDVFDAYSDRGTQHLGDFAAFARRCMDVAIHNLHRGGQYLHYRAVRAEAFLPIRDLDELVQNYPGGSAYDDARPSGRARCR